MNKYAPPSILVSKVVSESPRPESVNLVAQVEGLLGRKMSLSTNSNRPSPPMRGLGDAIERVTQATGIKAVVEYFGGGECGGCKKRRDALNRAVPFKGQK